MSKSELPDKPRGLEGPESVLAQVAEARQLLRVKLEAMQASGNNDEKMRSEIEKKIDQLKVKENEALIQLPLFVKVARELARTRIGSTYILSAARHAEEAARGVFKARKRGVKYSQSLLWSAVDAHSYTEDRLIHEMQEGGLLEEILRETKKRYKVLQERLSVAAQEVTPKDEVEPKAGVLSSNDQQARLQRTHEKQSEFEMYNDFAYRNTGKNTWEIVFPEGWGAANAQRELEGRHMHTVGSIPNDVQLRAYIDNLRATWPWQPQEQREEKSVGSRIEQILTHNRELQVDVESLKKHKPTFWQDGNVLALLLARQKRDKKGWRPAALSGEEKRLLIAADNDLAEVKGLLFLEKNPNALEALNAARTRKMDPMADDELRCMMRILGGNGEEVILRPHSSDYRAYRKYREELDRMKTGKLLHANPANTREVSEIKSREELFEEALVRNATLLRSARLPERHIEQYFTIMRKLPVTIIVSGKHVDKLERALLSARERDRLQWFRETIAYEERLVEKGV